MIEDCNPLQNHLLAALTPDTWQRLLPGLEYARLERREPLCDAGQVMTHAYFPTSAVVSLMDFTASGNSAESATVGNDGLVGLSLVMGGESSASSAVVHSAGNAFRLPAAQLKSEFMRGGDMMRLLLRYTQVMLTQTSQRALCNRHHSVRQQLARALLLQLDHVQGCELTMTQELLAEQLGVRREGITQAAGTLQRLGIIRYGRGQITVLNRAALERLSCECYATVRRECRRLLPAAVFA
jgi:CRP-like cAMP-binding protein